MKKESIEEYIINTQQYKDAPYDTVDIIDAYEAGYEKAAKIYQKIINDQEKYIKEILELYKAQ